MPGTDEKISLFSNLAAAQAPGTWTVDYNK
jgi:hypothetical protein